MLAATFKLRLDSNGCHGDVKGFSRHGKIEINVRDFLGLCIYFVLSFYFFFFFIFVCYFFFFVFVYLLFFFF